MCVLIVTPIFIIIAVCFFIKGCVAAATGDNGATFIYMVFSLILIYATYLTVVVADTEYSRSDQCQYMYDQDTGKKITTCLEEPVKEVCTTKYNVNTGAPYEVCNSVKRGNYS